MASRRWDVAALLAIAGAFVVTVVLWDRLPERVPTHFDLHGTPNGWMSRFVAGVGMPTFALVLWAFVRLLPRFLPKSDTRAISEGTIGFVAALKAIFIAALHAIVLYAAVMPAVTVTTPTFLLAGLMFVALGLIMPRMRRNPLIGVRTPWTLRDEENWARTHRIAGYTMTAAGLTGAIAGAFGGGPGVLVATCAFILGGIVPAAYSFVLARRLDA
jgi:uncharacterized membrane protein